MTTEELLQRRYKILAPGYPYCPWEVGSILHVDCDGELFSKQAGYPLSRRMVMASMADGYPNIFEPLPWWKERKVEDMPGYVKRTYNGEVLEFSRFKLEYRAYEDAPLEYIAGSYHISLFEPATASDYNAYLQTTNPLNNGQ